MRTLTISSLETLNSAVTEVVRQRIHYTRTLADRDAAVAATDKAWQPDLTSLAEQIAGLETDIQEYCLAHRSMLFGMRKSRETHLAEFGFELTPPRVETNTKRTNWKDVVARLSRLPWGKAYVRHPAPQPDKQALLTDREKLSPEMLTAAGIQFCQEEQFFLRPKPQTAKEAA